VASAKLFDNLDALADWLQIGSVVSVGNFDGVHLGHARIARQLANLGRKYSVPAVVFSFQPHPARVLRPDSAPVPLSWPQRKAALLGECGIDALIACPADVAMLSLTAEEFFHQVIVDHCHARAMVEGPNFHFGSGRAGDIALLTKLCARAPIEMHIVEPLMVGQQYISSSRIRALIAAGNLRGANELLTAPYRIRGRVTTGAQRGRTIGFPTANLAVTELLVPPHAVYAGRALVATSWFPAAVHIGPNPTFGDHATKIEVHLLGFDGDLYDTELCVELHDRIRGVRPFANVDALVAQLHEDVETVRQVISRKTVTENETDS